MDGSSNVNKSRGLSSVGKSIKRKVSKFFTRDVSPEKGQNPPPLQGALKRSASAPSLSSFSQPPALKRSNSAPSLTQSSQGAASVAPKSDSSPTYQGLSSIDVRGKNNPKETISLTNFVESASKRGANWEMGKSPGRIIDRETGLFAYFYCDKSKPEELHVFIAPMNENFDNLAKEDFGAAKAKVDAFASAIGNMLGELQPQYNKVIFEDIHVTQKGERDERYDEAKWNLQGGIEHAASTAFNDAQKDTSPQRQLQPVPVQRPQYQPIPATNHAPSSMQPVRVTDDTGTPSFYGFLAYMSANKQGVTNAVKGNNGTVFHRSNSFSYGLNSDGNVDDKFRTVTVDFTEDRDTLSVYIMVDHDSACQGASIWEQQAKDLGRLLAQHYNGRQKVRFGEVNGRHDFERVSKFMLTAKAAYEAEKARLSGSSQQPASN